MGDIFLGKLFGIPFRLHWSWFLAIFLISWTLSLGFFPQTLPEFETNRVMYWSLGILAALGLFLSILLHELGHAFVAKRYGIPVRGIRLFVFGGVAELGSDPKQAFHEILIALGGPAVTVLLIAIFHLALTLVVSITGTEWQLSDGLLTLQGGGPIAAGASALLFYLGMINTLVLFFNLIPAFPLDGGRVLRGILWAVSGSYLNSTRIAGGVGIAFSWLLFLGGFLMMFFGGNLLGGLWLFFLGMFLQNAAHSSIAYAQLQHMFRGVTVADMMRQNPVTVEGGLSLRDVADEYFLRYPYKAYPVVENGQYQGILTLRSLQEMPREQWQTLRANDVVHRGEPLPVIRPNEPMLQALRKLAESGSSRLAVVDNGQLVGLLCGRDVMKLMEIRAGLSMPELENASR